MSTEKKIIEHITQLKAVTEEIRTDVDQNLLASMKDKDGMKPELLETVEVTLPDGTKTKVMKLFIEMANEGLKNHERKIIQQVKHGKQFIKGVT